MHTLSDMAKVLSRSPVYLYGLQKHFDLPVFEAAAYSPAYLTFLRTLLILRTFNIAEAALLDLWQLEKKLLQLLHVDSTGSPTWYLDACGASTHPERRLLLTNHDLGVPLTSSEVQTGLNFAESLPELVAGTEMGEDILRVLRVSLQIRARILADLAAELPHLRAAAKWAIPLARSAPST